MTKTDSQFTDRFAPATIASFVANQSTLADWTPTTSVLNTGLMSDIGRATVYAPDIQDNWFSRFMKSPLPRGDSAMSMRFDEVTSRVYNPNAPDTDLFNGEKPGAVSNVAKKNLSRQIAVEINDYYLKQMVQTQDMIGGVEASLMAVSNVAYRDDMWVSSKAYFSGSTRGAKSTQLHTLTNGPEDAGFADEMTELLWSISQKDFGYKSTAYNASGVNTKSNRVAVALKKDVEFPTFKKLLSETFNPDLLRIEVDGGIGYVDDFATPAGKPSTAGELLGMVVDTRAFAITPMPGTMTVETFRNPVRKSTAYFTTYEYAFQHDPFFNIAYIFAPGS